ncbi:MAG: maltose/maltodextrin ABC transporter substrate-binding protein MalE, partial [Rhodobacteraceae bacterium]|nr:maltose/maltodextrin ABC transporter substrate-binding protein MalE [Paracoccaceae bacterium]
HDRFGEWASGGLIAPVQPAAAWSDGVLDSTMDAVSFDGAIWGYPVSVEAVHLIYNTDLIDTPPASFEELISMDFDGQKILWDYNNTYFTMPLLMANGGFAFEKVDGSYDGSTTGVNNEGAVAGAQMLDRLIEEGVMPAGVDYGVMDGAMNKGDVAMVLNGPWAWPGLKDSGINFAVAPIPTVNGADAMPFLGVQALAVNAATPNADLAVELLENYLLTDDGLATWNAGGALGALADISAAAAQDDANIAGMLDVAATGVPMPSNPEMGAFWAAMGPALTNITSGAQEPEAALNDAAARILGK